MKVMNHEVRGWDVARAMTDVADTAMIATGFQGHADMFVGPVILAHGLSALEHTVSAALPREGETRYWDICRKYSAGRQLLMALGDATALTGYGLAASGGGVTPLVAGAAGSLIANFAQYCCD